MHSLWNLFSKPNQEIKSAKNSQRDLNPVLDNEIITILNPSRYENFSALGKKICQAIENNPFYKVVDTDTNSYAGKLTGIRFVHHSKHPGYLPISESASRLFKEADYFLEVTTEGKVKYEVLFDGTYYPVKLATVDPDVKFFHEENIQPLLANERAEETENVNSCSENTISSGLRMRK